MLRAIARGLSRPEDPYQEQIGETAEQSPLKLRSARSWNYHIHIEAKRKALDGIMSKPAAAPDVTQHTEEQKVIGAASELIQ